MEKKKINIKINKKNKREKKPKEGERIRWRKMKMLKQEGSIYEKIEMNKKQGRNKKNEERGMRKKDS